MRHLIYISVFLCVPFIAMAQDSLHVIIPVAYVSVNGDSQINFSSDSVNLAWNNSSSVGELLRNQANFISRSYGARGTAVTASGQGLSANQFTATWNGFELNSPTLGTMDLGILSPAMFSSLQLNQHSFGVSPAQSSGTGGWLELKTNNGSNEIQQLQFSANSIGNQSGTLILPYQLKRLKLVTRLNYIHALNEFEYTDDLRRVYVAESNSWDHPTLIQDHNNHVMISVIQGVSLSIKDWLVDGQVWYQNSRSFLPELKGSYGQSFAEQSDSSLRATLSFKGSLLGLNSHFSLARFEESQRYIDRHTEEGDLVINSKIKTKVLSARAHFKGEWKVLQWGTVTNFTRKTAATKNYRAHLNPSQNIWSQSVQLGISKRNSSFDANARIDLIQEQRTLPVIDFVAIQGLNRKGNIRIRAAYSRMFRVPTFNELYWQSDSERELNSESGEKITLGIDAELACKKTSFRFDAFASYTQMSEMIQWNTSNGVSTPQNTGEFEAGNLSGRFEVEHGQKLKKVLTYQINVLKYLDAPFWISQSMIEIEPSLRQNLGLNMSFGAWSLLVQSSSRKNDLFPGADPGSLKTPVVIHSLGASYRFDRKQSSIQAQFLIDNVLNTPNHFLRAYAMPGRVLRIELIYKRVPQKQSK